MLCCSEILSLQVGVVFTDDDGNLEGVVACSIENMSFRTDFAPGPVCPRESKAHGIKVKVGSFAKTGL